MSGDGLHCLSAFTTFPTRHHFVHQRSGRAVSIAFRHSPRSRPIASAIVDERSQVVSIAFRHSPRSRRGNFSQVAQHLRRSPLPFGIHHVPDRDLRANHGQKREGLHCLSAFTTFPTRRWPRGTGSTGTRVSIAFRHSPRSRPVCGSEDNSGRALSPLPFGIHHVPDPAPAPTPEPEGTASPLPFGIHHVPDAHAEWAKLVESVVSIAFRHSPRSRRVASQLVGASPLASPLPFGIHHVPDLKPDSKGQRQIFVSIAFRHSPRSRPRRQAEFAAILASPLPFGIHHVPDPDAFALWLRVREAVSIAFRHSPRSRRPL